MVNRKGCNIIRWCCVLNGILLHLVMLSKWCLVSPACFCCHDIFNTCWPKKTFRLHSWLTDRYPDEIFLHCLQLLSLTKLNFVYFKVVNSILNVQYVMLLYFESSPLFSTFLQKMSTCSPTHYLKQFYRSISGP